MSTVPEGSRWGPRFVTGSGEMQAAWRCVGMDGAALGGSGLDQTTYKATTKQKTGNKSAKVVFLASQFCMF